MSESFEQVHGSLPPRDIDAGNAPTSKHPDRPLPIISTPTSSTVGSFQPPEEVVEISKVMLQGLRPPQQEEEETASIKTRAPTPTPTVDQGSTTSTTAKVDHTRSTESQIQSHRDLKPNLNAPWHRIRLEPHAPHHTIPSLHFNNLTHDLQEGAPPLWIGRFTNTFRHSDKIAFRSKVVSRNHAELWVGHDGKFYIRDTASSSGTFVNYERLSRANEKSDPFQIRDGDILQLGVNYQGGQESIYQNVGIRVHIDGPIPPPSATGGFSLGSEEGAVRNSHIDAPAQADQGYTGRPHDANITSPSDSSLSPSIVTALSKSPVSTDEMKDLKQRLNGDIEDDIGSRRRQAVAEHIAKLNEIRFSDGVHHPRETQAVPLLGLSSIPPGNSGGNLGTRSGDQGNTGQLIYGESWDTEGAVGGTGEGEEPEVKAGKDANLLGVGGVTPQVAAPAGGGTAPVSELGASRDEVKVEVEGSEAETVEYEDANVVFKYLAIANTEATQKNVQNHSDYPDSDQPSTWSWLNQLNRSSEGFYPPFQRHRHCPEMFSFRLRLRIQKKVLPNSSTPEFSRQKTIIKIFLKPKTPKHKGFLIFSKTYGHFALAQSDYPLILMKLLNSPRVVGDVVRGSILTALLRLSASSGLYPQQLRLHDIEKESSPVTAGQFGEIWRGEYHGRPVCLKIFKLYQRSEIDFLLKVR